jgi:hypothetical protein
MAILLTLDLEQLTSESRKCFVPCRSIKGSGGGRVGDQIELKDDSAVDDFVEIGPQLRSDSVI